MPPGTLPPVVRRPATNPILPVDDMAAAIDFSRRLGFEVGLREYSFIDPSGNLVRFGHNL